MPGSDSRALPDRDLRHVLDHTTGIWEDLTGARVFVTGGTGFFGRWMLESFIRANEDLGLRAELVVLSRDPHRFADSAPHVAGNDAVAVHAGDVGSFEFPPGSFSHVLHMATESGPSFTAAASLKTAVVGTERVLAFAAERDVRCLLLTSSGAVYGRQPPDCDRVTEDFAGSPDPDDAAAGYANGKRAAERLCAAAAEAGLETKIARCFAFVGPLLPLDLNFAIGNFIRDALRGKQIEVNGDGSPRRSYLYAADLAAWLWTILVHGESNRPYNVGSETDLSIADLANTVAATIRPGLPVEIAGTPIAGALPPRYVPSTARARDELGLDAWIALDDGIRRTADWNSP